MVPSLDLLAVLNLLGAGQGLLLALAIATVKRGGQGRAGAGALPRRGLYARGVGER